MDNNNLIQTSPGMLTQGTATDDEADNTVSSATSVSASMTQHQPSKTGIIVSNDDVLDSSPTTCSSNESPNPKNPLNLLDLPLDILREIVKEITLTHDLTSLALTCSALHSLAIPAMYSRFDIVWPEPAPVSDQPMGVDALSYGLATLVMGANVFKETPRARHNKQRCQHCGCDGPRQQCVHGSSSLRTNYGGFRIGNNYAQWTKKFCVGNGPNDWVQEYAITKETGKLLGTLVALAVARMANLETFIWDMPTGVMRDVFLALASLDARSGDRECHLERVWVRWHDNRQKNPVFHTWTHHRPVVDLYQRVEYPTFSVLPPLKSLSVLNIDEPAYLQEMAILIERSRSRLRELRIGMATTCATDSWVYPTELEPTSDEPSRSSLFPGWPKSGGVLSILLNIPATGMVLHTVSPSAEPNGSKNHHGIPSSPTSNIPNEQSTGVTVTTHMLGDLTVDETQGTTDSQVWNTTSLNADSNQVKVSGSPVATARTSSEKQERLKLEILELENVVIYTPLLMKAIDLTRLTTLTILHCDEHESLWRALRRKFSPSTESSRQGSDNAAQEAYPFKLKHLHTDRVSPYLMLFLKEAIAPNTLESIYLQEGRLYTTVVSIEAIYKHVLRRQRASLRKVLIDRSRRGEPVSINHGHWRDWMFPREALAFVTSGKMPQLRELGIGMDRRDWHFFLQRLPRLANLRALYLPNMFDPTLGRNKHRELALQILDIVTLRPEIQLCYIGIEHKCFEILETPVNDKIDRELYRDSPWYSESDSDEPDDQTNGHDSESHSEDEEDDEVEGGDDDVHTNPHAILEMDEDTEDDSEYRHSNNGSRFVFRLREILFYDDKISVFKSRHCSL
ncbi:conserved hypothetical protein [Talaromyces stipitatus ATCC 10500]|uniref:F-box domain-containing protein n=1 Tax=Talaromyces stipitatus (strain ATCC 10500 / CBS 375.48 / QM 6759 / NRRL 1006) TaxID=441959 RepID=B8LYW8_TALSN|nr:uncharacterized protein TSTA_068990 [Talaromyces stipitatus ATCC 10500]EED23476.1 conserved hypothetical protein [Talaromyces stipitatus ATCC 10500]